MRGSDLKRVWRWALGRDLLVFPETEVPALQLGTEYGAHAVCSVGLGPGSVVYSFGVGEDISFDVALCERFGVTLHAFDPTPRSIEWVKTQALPERFVFHPVGVADVDGTLPFRPPDDPTHVSHTLLDRPSTDARSIELPVRTLPSLMCELGHDRLDVLKLDVEGAEYGVLSQLCVRAIPIDQLLVEFHHQFEGVPRSTTGRAIAELRRAGYRVFDVSASGHEYSFVHERLLRAVG